jgi:hypothetical protein
MRAAMAPGRGVFIGAASGGHELMARISASPCFEATARCAATQSCRRCSYLAREARQRRVEVMMRRSLADSGAGGVLCIEPAPPLAPPHPLPPGLGAPDESSRRAMEN